MQHYKHAMVLLPCVLEMSFGVIAPLLHPLDILVSRRKVVNDEYLHYGAKLIWILLSLMHIIELISKYIDQYQITNIKSNHNLRNRLKELCQVRNNTQPCCSMCSHSLQMYKMA